MITVLHLILTLEGGGAERQLAILAKQQSEYGLKVHIVLTREGGNIKILNNKINFGYGGSVKKGIDSSQKEYVIWAPGNLRKDIELVVFATMLSIIYPGKGQRDDFCYAISCLLKKWGQWSEERINKFI